MPSNLFPAFGNFQEYLKAPRDAERYLAGIDEIRHRHGLPSGDIFLYGNGTTLVFGIGGDHVIKLFPPMARDHYENERIILRHLQGENGIPTPDLIASGEMEGWCYVIMDQVPGMELKKAWPEIAHENRVAICRELGGITARLHALPVEGMETLDRNWNGFLAERRERAIERQRGQGLDEYWIGLIPEYLDGIDLAQPENFSPVLLHTELMRDHVIVDRKDRWWEISGLIDFEPSMLGHPEYEFASAGLFVAGGVGEFFRAFLDGYGMAPDALTPEFQRRIMAHALLHRYSDLKWYFSEVPVDPSVRTFDELARAWWGFSA